MSPNEPAPQPRPSLVHKPYILFWMTRICSAFGYQMATVAIGWFVYDKTQSAYNLGFLGLCQFLPMLALTFLVGNVADRVNRRRIVMTCQSLECAIFIFLTLGAWQGWLNMAWIFTAMTLSGAIRSFENPTLSALLPALVPAPILHRAIALSSSAMQTATILGPSLGGLLYAFGIRVPLGLSALLFACALLSMRSIRLERPVTPREPVTFRSVFAGVSFVWGRPIILGVISLDLFAVLLGGVTALLPIFARDILHAGPVGLGLLRSAPAVGALSMSAILTRRTLGQNIGIKMFVSVLIFGLATIVFSLSTNLALSIAALFALGASDNVSVVIRSSLVQLSTPDSMRGRVNAVNSLFIGTSNQLGEFESGMTAGLLGPVGAGILGGVGTILVVLIWMKLFPTLRRFSTLANVKDF